MAQRSIRLRPILHSLILITDRRLRTSRCFSTCVPLRGAEQRCTCRSVGRRDPPEQVPSPIYNGIENSQRFRALPLFASLLSLGKDGYADIVRRNVAFAQRTAHYLDLSPLYEPITTLLSPPEHRQTAKNNRLFRSIPSCSTVPCALLSLSPIRCPLEPHESHERCMEDARDGYEMARTCGDSAGSRQLADRWWWR